MFDNHSVGATLIGYPADKLAVNGGRPMKFRFLYIFLILALPALGQKPLPALQNGTVIDEKTEFRHDGSLLIAGHVKLKGISLDLRGPVTVAAGADLELEDVNIKGVRSTRVAERRQRTAVRRPGENQNPAIEDDCGWDCASDLVVAGRCSRR